ncbi:MAG: tagatose-bisphosphate aldolase [Candidatus Vogelbacteria bacterium CG10_big_fil_rev_8_21_14_0_10_50_13]|uniref:Tagatose-bisphosphate aldolase n=1 Tax=Candidatus Vogelbacteria bacterium CG10_big_fil_rev_8_21_14_0_10_50_13 TaxID=1975044 RepID=A0A2H0RG42_9BACT|nr:MAG: tagatose-bisphosphate aldolase [Candidatus Vogelbacteria bacterium CG10_big_fil_rev_8_21_14_0_10_50_13]
MKKLKDVVDEAKRDGRAVGHFNVATLDMLRGVAVAAASLSVPVVIGVSEGERSALGVRQIAALIKSLREETGQEIYLNADHTTSLESAKVAVDAGFDAVLADGSALAPDENVTYTKQVAEYARSKNPNILVEGEMGLIGRGSQVLSEVPAEVAAAELTTPEAASEFAAATGVDLLAPAVGNLHGVLANRPNPNLDIERVRAISAAVNVPLVLHGGSGTSDEDVAAAIKAGCAIVHVSTELRLAWRDAVKLAFADNPDEVAPYKLLKPAMQAVAEVATAKLRLFNNLD